jgi:hypothetical protein
MASHFKLIDACFEHWRTVFKIDERLLRNVRTTELAEKV